VGRIIVRKAATAADSNVPLTVDEEALFEVVRRALFAVGQGADTDAIARAVVTMDPDLLTASLQTVGLRPLEDKLVAAIGEVINAEGVRTGKKLRTVIEATPAWGNEFTLTGTPSVSFSFDVADPAASAFARRQAGRLITAIDESNRNAIRHIINESVSRGVDVPMTGRRIRQFIGLHPRWAGAVDKYYATQVRSLLKQGLSAEAAQERAHAVTDLYRRRLIRKRATMIARTEIQTAQNWGRQLGWQQAVSKGYVDGDSTKEWSSAYKNNPFGPPCEICGPMKGERVKWNQAFSNGVFMPPAHPNCRCTAVLVPPDRGLNDDAWVNRGLEGYK